MKKIVCVLLALALLTTLLSCIAVGSGGKTVEQKPTVGQELIDLKLARDEGAISEQEYKEMKEKIKQNQEGKS
jgi:hypothetical protein